MEWLNNSLMAHP